MTTPRKIVQVRFPQVKKFKAGRKGMSFEVTAEDLETAPNVEAAILKAIQRQDPACENILLASDVVWLIKGATAVEYAVPEEIGQYFLDRTPRREDLQTLGEGPPAAMEFDGIDIFVTYDGKKVAKRGHPDTPEAMTWVSLEPGFTVIDVDDDEIEIRHNGVRVH